MIDVNLFMYLIYYARYGFDAIKLWKCYCNWVNALLNNAADDSPLKPIGVAFINECKNFVEYVCCRDNTTKTLMITFLDEHMNPALHNVCNKEMCDLQNYINNFLLFNQKLSLLIYIYLISI